jgi:hypothetical protein
MNWLMRIYTHVIQWGQALDQPPAFVYKVVDPLLYRVPSEQAHLVVIISFNSLEGHCYF